MQKKLYLACGAFSGLLIGCGPPMANNTPAPPPVQQQAPPPAEPRVAEVGVGIKGRSLEGETGISKIIAAPAVTLFRTRERVVFEIQIPQAMQLFEASEGRPPKSNDEFMEKIIKFNNIPLPELPKGQVYRYNPEDKQLWVDPAPAQPAAKP